MCNEERCINGRCCLPSPLGLAARSAQPGDRAWCGSVWTEIVDLSKHEQVLSLTWRSPLSFNYYAVCLKSIHEFFFPFRILRSFFDQGLSPKQTRISITLLNLRFPRVPFIAKLPFPSLGTFIHVVGLPPDRPWSPFVRECSWPEVLQEKLRKPR